MTCVLSKATPASPNTDPASIDWKDGADSFSSSLISWNCASAKASRTGVEGIDVGAAPADAATVKSVGAARGTLPNRVTVTFNDFVQDIETWGDCKRAKPSPCK